MMSTLSKYTQIKILLEHEYIRRSRSIYSGKDSILGKLWDTKKISSFKGPEDY